MAWKCPNCGELQHQIGYCKFCGFKIKVRITKEKLMAMRKFRMPQKYWDDWKNRKRPWEPKERW